MRRLLLIAAVCSGLGCSEPTAAPATSHKRATLERITGATFRLVPAEGQLPYCLAYTVSQSGLIRQLTMSRLNASYECRSGQPIGKYPFRVPLDEGPVKVHVIFTSQPVNAGSVSQQLVEVDNPQSLMLMNLRLPGNAAIETLDFLPEEDVPAQLGELVGHDAGAATAPAATPDAGN